MSKQVQLFLIPAPGKKPEFLATVEGNGLDSSLPPTIVLEGYTRDGWAWKPNPSIWQTLTVKSVDGRNKLPGFLKYLKERQKSAYGRFGEGKSSIWVVSYIQKAPKDGSPPCMDCRFAWDLSTIPACPFKPKPSSLAAAPLPPPTNNNAKQTEAAPRKKGGLLGNLLKSQKRTNEHLGVFAKKGQSANGGQQQPGQQQGKKTSLEVLAEFRQLMQEKFLDFDISSEPVKNVKVTLSEYTKDMAESEKPKVTMELLKYIVYEQAEEINDEWIAHKEPSEFMDEISINVYKEGEAPPEVLEEINKGELPDEVRGQQRALQEERSKAMSMREEKRTKQLQQEALRGNGIGDDIEALNQNKRDRRTIEDFQKEGDGANKKSRI